MASITTSCPFCDPKERVFKENEHAYCLLSNPRLMPGHLLVIPKRHVEKPWELSDEEVRDIFSLIKFLQQKIVPALATGVDVRQHYRPFLPESRTKVNHVHYHVLPRTFQDELWLKVESHDQELFRDLSKEEQKRITKLID
ncbi:MAG: HIT family protein [Minisyncoccia bacterium]